MIHDQITPTVVQSYDMIKMPSVFINEGPFVYETLGSMLIYSQWPLPSLPCGCRVHDLKEACKKYNALTAERLPQVEQIPKIWSLQLL